MTRPVSGDDSGQARVRVQFGRAAEAYAVSRVHAQGESLARLVELAEPSPAHRVLDVATAAGHTALAFAPHVAAVVGVDLTPETLAVARRLAAERGAANIEFREGDAEHLPAADGEFDRVVCRIALHHFPDAGAAAREMARVVRPGGRVLLVDNIVPRDPRAAAFINRFETVRDPSHHWAYPLADLADLFTAVGLRVRHLETLSKAMDFHDWAARMAVPAPLEAALWSSLSTSTGRLRAFFDPTEADGRRHFTLHEGIVVADRPA